jgi:hypothetical protein
MLVGNPYVTHGLQAGNTVWSDKLTQERSDRCPMSFALLTVVLAMAAVALVLLGYYVLRRWL